MKFEPVTIICTVIAAFFAITLHECAHGYVAYLLGDTTAKDEGRLTLNPIKHLDPFGLVSLIILHIGWAKPVPINPMNFKNRRSGTILVSLAGPMCNMLLAFLSAVCAHFTNSFSLYLTVFFMVSMQINIGFAIFNMMPFPPLDGSKIIASVLPPKWEYNFYRYEKYLSIIVLILYFTNLIDYIFYPPMEFIYNFLFDHIIL